MKGSLNLICAKSTSHLQKDNRYASAVVCLDLGSDHIDIGGGGGKKHLQWLRGGLLVYDKKDNYNMAHQTGWSQMLKSHQSH